MFDIGYIEIILSSCLGFFFIIQLVYYIVYFGRLARHKNKSSIDESDLPPVSVIITAKNESQNLTDFLPTVLEQNYPQFEVIVVNEGSTDESELVLGILEKRYSHLYHTYIPEEAKYLSHKKLAVTIGIKAAKYDVLLFLEANCNPKSPDWMRLMSRHFSESNSVVLGCSTLSKSHGFFSKFAVYDNLFNTIQYLSLALCGHPYRGVGRNLAYKKELFFSRKGFSKYLNLQAGEDDLFVNQVANSRNTMVEMDPDSITTTNLENFSQWKELRVCQATTQRYYKFGPVLFWRLESFSRCLFYASMVALIIYGMKNPFIIAIVVFLFLARFVTQLLVVNLIAKKMSLEFFYFTLLFFDLIQPVFDFYIYIYQIIRGKKDYTWR